MCNFALLREMDSKRCKIFLKSEDFFFECEFHRKFDIVIYSVFAEIFV